MITSKNILVTGGAGFIGSAVAQRLRSDGHEVVVIDNFNDYYDVELKRARQRELLDGVEVIEGSITDITLLEKLFSDHRFDAVAHLAAQGGVRFSVEHPEVYVESNVVGTQTLLEAMQKHNCKRLVYASTSSVYGTSTAAPFKETAVADRPVSVYAATKRTGELLAHVYYSMYGIEATCLRFFTVYGPWSRPDMAMFKFAKLMKAGKSVDVYNNGDLRRDFTYIDDIVEGFKLAIEKPLGYEIINLGNGSPVELGTLITTLEHTLGIEAEKNMLPMQAGDVYETYADTTRAKELLGFEAKTDFMTGTKRFVDWFNNYIV